MSLTLYFHPLSSFCHKVLIPLYENGTPFTPQAVDLRDEKSAAPLKALWPIGTFPVLHDEARGVSMPEATIIIEYLAQHYPGPVALIPADPDRARETRLKDRFFDNYIHVLMQKCMGDRLRPEGKHDPQGRRGRAEADQCRARHARTGDGDTRLGDGRGVRHGRLRRRPRAVLHRHGDPAG